VDGSDKVTGKKEEEDKKAERMDKEAVEQTFM